MVVYSFSVYIMVAAVPVMKASVDMHVLVWVEVVRIITQRYRVQIYQIPASRISL